VAEFLSVNVSARHINCRIGRIGPDLRKKHEFSKEAGFNARDIGLHELPPGASANCS